MSLDCNQGVSILEVQVECKHRGKSAQVRDSCWNKTEGIREITKNSILEQNKDYFIGHTGILVSPSAK